MLRLITISISHYAEKAKWALEACKIPYKEESFVPGVHAGPALWYTRGNSRTTPILIDSEQIVPDSTKILQHLAERYNQSWLYPNREALALEERFDENLGPHSRRFIYRQLFDAGFGLGELFTQPIIPQWQRTLLQASGPVIKAAMISSMQITDAGAEESRRALVAEFEAVAHLLSDGRRYLAGGEFSAADITFASLAAPLLLPENYGAPMPALTALETDHPLRQVINQYRSTQAGAYAMRMYREHRPQCNS